MDREDLSLFTKKKPLPPDSDEEDFGFERSQNDRRHAETFGKPIDEDVFDMEKYRPHNYEVQRPKGDDINDLVDYYSNYKMTRNALQRTNVGGMRTSPFKGSGQYSNDFDDEHSPMMMRHKKFSNPNQRYSPDDDTMSPAPQAPPRKKYSDPEDYSFERRRPSFEFGESLDPATRLILMKNTDPGPRKRFDEGIPNEETYSRPNFGNQSRLGGSGRNYDDDMDHLRPSPPAPDQRPPADAMSSHTRQMLDKLKQSTAELNDLTDGTEEPVFNPKRSIGAGRQQKKSRFLKNNISTTEPLYEEEPDSRKYVNSLANNILGLRDDSMGDFDKFRPNPVRISPPRRHSKKSFDMYDDDLPKISQKKYQDDDDTDAMIANLKKQTTRRAATDILNDIEPVDIVKFEPIKSFKDTFRPSPEPEINKYGSLNRSQMRQQKNSYLDQDDTPNPFSSLRPQNSAYGGPKKQSYGGYDDSNSYGGASQHLGGGQDGGNDFGGAIGHGRHGGGGGGGGQQYGSLGRNGLGPAQQQQQQYMQQQQAPMYGQTNMSGAYGGDLYGMQGGYEGYGGGGPPQQQNYQQPYGQQQGYGGGVGYNNGMGGPQGGYDQASYGQYGVGPPQGQGPMGGMGNIGGYGQQQQQMPGAGLRTARHQRYGSGPGGW